MKTFQFISLLTVFISVSHQHLLEENEKGKELFLYRQNIHAARQLIKSECPEFVRLKHGIYDDSAMPFHSEVAKILSRALIETLTECLTNTTASESGLDQPISDRLPTTEGAVSRQQSLTDLPTAAQQTTEQPVTSAMPDPQDCQELYDRGTRCSGIYHIRPRHSEDTPFPVWCDFIDDHGWTVIQKRFNGNVSFNRNWTDYQTGFGDINGEYWLGLDKIHAITGLNNKLSIFVKAANGTSKFGFWSRFYVNNIADGYRLVVSNSGYVGSLDSSALNYHNGRKFSTPDHDQDTNSGNCAATKGGGWWYYSCNDCLLNGVYGATGWGGIMWKSTYNHYTESVMRVSRS